MVGLWQLQFVAARSKPRPFIRMHATCRCQQQHAARKHHLPLPRPVRCWLGRCPLQGTHRTQRKKQAKLKRVMTTVRKQARKGEASGAEAFAALHLLHDPQAFAERLFSRLQSGSERFETRMAIMSVMSRIIGVHK